MANAIKLISKRAKELQRRNPSSKWMACIKEASREYRAGALGGHKPAKPPKHARKKSKPRPVKRARKHTRKPARLHGHGIETKSKTHTDYNRQRVNIQIGEVPNLEKFTDEIPALPRQAITIKWGEGNTVHGYLLNNGSQGLLLVKCNPLMRKHRKKKYYIVQGGFLMAAVLKKYGYEVNAGGSLFIHHHFYEATGRDNIRGMSWKEIKKIQKKF